MNFAQAMMEMFDESAGRKVVICDSIAKMSEECEPNFGTEIIGYAKLKTKGVCRITVDTCGETWGKFRICSFMDFDEMDMADDTWRVVSLKERREDILRRYPKEERFGLSVEDITKARRRRIESAKKNRLARRTVLLSESQDAMTNAIMFVMDRIDSEAVAIYSSNDIVTSDQDVVIFSKVRLQMLKEIRESSEFKALLDICDRIGQEWDEEKEA